jgi:hypothetical protein
MSLGILLRYVGFDVNALWQEPPALNDTITEGEIADWLVVYTLIMPTNSS